MNTRYTKWNIIIIPTQNLGFSPKFFLSLLERLSIEFCSCTVEIQIKTSYWLYLAWY